MTYSEKTSADVEALFEFTSAKQVIAALKYGIAPFIGFVIERPTKANRELLEQVLELYDRVVTDICVQTESPREDLLEELRSRKQEIKDGIVMESKPNE